MKCQRKFYKLLEGTGVRYCKRNRDVYLGRYFTSWGNKNLAAVLRFQTYYLFKLVQSDYIQI